jgi:hypothetical protein
LFLLLRVALLKYSLVNRAIFPDFCTRPYTYSALPPCAHARPCAQPCSPEQPCNACHDMRSESKILNAFNSKKRFFNEFNGLEDLEY